MVVDREINDNPMIPMGAGLIDGMEHGEYQKRMGNNFMAPSLLRQRPLKRKFKKLRNTRFRPR